MNATCANLPRSADAADSPRQAPPHLRTILLATDLGAGSAELLRLACAMARDPDARLLVLHVRPNLRPVVAYGRARVQLTHPSEDAEQLGARLRQLQATDPAVHLEHLLAEGDPATEILRAAKERGCDLIVLGLQGRTGLERLLTGGVVDVVLRRARCLVALVKVPGPGCA